MGQSVALLSGEVSGDVVGAALAHELRVRRPGLKLWGMGSRRMAGAGVELLHDSSHWSAIGVVEAIKVYPELRLKVYPHIVREIERRNPSVAVLIDFGAFNMKVARRCHATGVPTLYYFPPGSWRRTGRSGAELARVATQVATPFPWSAERLARLGVNVEFVGHPLLETARPSGTCEDFTRRFGMTSSKPIVGLLPGSRRFEIEHNAPVMLDAAWLIHARLPETQFVFGLAASARREDLESLIRGWQARRPAAPTKHGTDTGPSDDDERERHGKAPSMVTPEGIVLPGGTNAFRKDLATHAVARRPCAPTAPPIVVVQDQTYDVMAHSDALLVCSGTATLEAAILGTPMVIMYRGSRLMEMEYRLRRIDRVEHIGMPNIIAGRRIVPELIQREATPSALAEQTLRYLLEPDVRAAARAELKSVRSVLGEPGASARVAEMVLALADRPRD